ncbi:MAG: ASCH domain-containing protein [Clostridia bacterium]|nr:ASCH domain-containing protein [Clostridia bacterium]
MQDPTPVEGLKSTILISVRPAYARAILNGTKTCEYRRSVPRRPVSRMLIYETAPAKHIMGEAEVIGLLELPVEELWERTKALGGLTEAAYRQYFHGQEIAHAFLLGRITAYEEPVELKATGVSRAPQSWMYL